VVVDGRHPEEALATRELEVEHLQDIGDHLCHEYDTD
jgi:hypothetical protein